MHSARESYLRQRRCVCVCDGGQVCWLAPRCLCCPPRPPPTRSPHPCTASTPPPPCSPMRACGPRGGASAPRLSWGSGWRRGRQTKRRALLPPPRSRRTCDDARRRSRCCASVWGVAGCVEGLRFVGRGRQGGAPHTSRAARLGPCRLHPSHPHPPPFSFLPPPLQSAQLRAQTARFAALQSALDAAAAEQGEAEAARDAAESAAAEALARAERAEAEVAALQVCVREAGAASESRVRTLFRCSPRPHVHPPTHRPAPHHPHHPPGPSCCALFRACSLPAGSLGCSGRGGGAGCCRRRGSCGCGHVFRLEGCPRRSAGCCCC